MSFPRRVRTIYGKELIDLLRDRRTLIAMIVVPITLYPLLMLGSLQAISAQGRELARKTILVGGIGPADGDQATALVRLIHEYDRIRALREHQAKANAAGNGVQNPPTEDNSSSEALLPLDVAWVPLESTEQIRSAVRERTVHIGILFRTPLDPTPGASNEIELFYDREETRGATAHARLRDMLDIIGEQWNVERRARLGISDTLFKPFSIHEMNLSSPTSILGQILPLILILMTITGAIYPAIDITAGERERGTLESLLVCPVPVLDLIVGKFLVVTTIAILGATLNLASVCATVYFGGFNEMISAGGGGLPVGQLLIILLCLIPFAILMSAILLAVCSYARTFKEAQNYVTPVILAVLIPGGMAALPAAELTGGMLVMPVGNMVLLTRELLVGAAVPASALLIVLLSTTLYAAAAVAAAAHVFGRETVVFSDVATLRGTFDRRLIRPARRPTLTMSLIVTALLFPLWFYLQTGLQGNPSDKNNLDALRMIFGLMPLFFVGIPLAVAWYWRTSIVESFALHGVKPRHLAAAVLLGCGTWAMAHALFALQFSIFGMSPVAEQSGEALMNLLRPLSTPEVLLLMAIIPAVCEELLFRGFLLSAFRDSGRMLAGLTASAAVFAVFHFILAKAPVTFLLGLLLAWVCWRTRSILPGIIIHAMHNGILTLAAVKPAVGKLLHLEGLKPGDYLPVTTLAVAGALLLTGILLIRGSGKIDRAGSSSDRGISAS